MSDGGAGARGDEVGAGGSAVPSEPSAPSEGGADARGDDVAAGGSAVPSEPSAPSEGGDEAPGGGAPSRHLEVETKLEVDAAFAVPDLARLLTSGAAASAAPPTVLDLHATYFDTTRLDLLHSRVTLRRRSGGVDDGWHLKLPAGAGARTEVALPLSAEPADRVPEELARLVAGLARGGTLRPVARLDTARTVRRLAGGDGTDRVELADDAVTATRLLPGEDPTPRRWRELEVEVLDGTPEDMLAVTDALIAAGARPSTVGSKLARALGVSGPEELPNPPAGASAGEVVIAALAGHRRQLLVADLALRQSDPGADALHDARAAARRIRSVLSVFEPLFLPGTAGPLIGALRALGAAIGTARDLDVVTARIRSVPDVAARLASRRAGHLADVQRYLGGEDYLAALRGLDDLVERPALTALASRPAKQVLAPMLAMAWFRLQARADATLAAASNGSEAPDALVAEAGSETPGARAPVDAPAHETRKAAKTVRYAAEAATPALGKPCAELARFAEQVQRILGEHQDAVTTVAALREASDAPPTGVAASGLAASLRSERGQAAQALEEFLALWSGRPEAVI